jgi:hypothetical protein
VGQDDAGVLPDPREHGEQHVALQALGLVDDDERVVQRPAADVGERQHLEHPAVEDLLDHLARHHAAEGVEDGLPPRVHLLGLGAREVAELLAAHGVQRPEDDDLAVLAPLHDGLDPGAQGEGGLARAGAATEETMPTSGSSKQVEGDALLGAAAVQAEGVAVTHAPGAPACRRRPGPGRAARRAAR